MNDNYTPRLFLVKARSYGISERKNAFLNEYYNECAYAEGTCKKPRFRIDGIRYAL